MKPTDEQIRVAEVANVISEASGNYSIAFVNESDGSWDVVESFAADSDADANEFAERNYDGQEWFVLDQHGRNING